MIPISKVRRANLKFDLRFGLKKKLPRRPFFFEKAIVSPEKSKVSSKETIFSRAGYFSI